MNASDRIEPIEPPAVIPQCAGGSCSCRGTGSETPVGAAGARFIYAIGRIDTRFPNLAAEKEFAQAAGRSDTSGKTDRQTFHSVLSRRENRYLLRELCWVLSIQGVDSYLLQPRDPSDFDRLVEAIRPSPAPNDVDVVIGVRGPIASPETCNGLMVPIVAFDQIYSFDRGTLMGAIPKPDGIAPEQFGPASEEVFNRVIELADNAGAIDEHRALNYLVMRYPAVYARASEGFARGFSLTGVDVRPSPLSSTRRLTDVIFSYTNRATDFTEKFFVRVDVTEEFPFLVTKLSPYYDR